MKGMVKTLVVLTLVFAGAYAQATPVELNVTNESDLGIKAVLWGGLIETPFEFVDGARVWQETFESEFWRVQARITERYQMGGMMTNLQVTAQHLVAAHAGEVAPGFELTNLHLNLGGDSRYEIRPVAELASDAIHPGAEEHHDHLVTFVMDMDETLPGLLSGDGQIYAVIEANHIMPEPATLALMGAGVGLLIRRRRK